MKNALRRSENIQEPANFVEVAKRELHESFASPKTRGDDEIRRGDYPLPGLWPPHNNERPDNTANHSDQRWPELLEEPMSAPDEWAAASDRWEHNGRLTCEQRGGD